MWNYRVFHEVCHGENVYSIIECYYDSQGKATMRSDAHSAHGETPEELKEDLQRMLRAFDKPTLTEADFHTTTVATIAIDKSE